MLFLLVTFDAVFGVMFGAYGIFNGLEAEIYQGVLLLSASLSLFSGGAIIQILKDIRDTLKKSAS